MYERKKDLRIQKSKQSIFNAFLEMRSRLDIEKITVTELCRKAAINKSTFYVYYRDVYDLSEQLELELVEAIMDSIDQSEDAFENPELFTKNLFAAYDAKKLLIERLFSGSRSNELPKKVEKSIREYLISIRPEYVDQPDKVIMMSYVIFGSFYAYLNNKQFDGEAVINKLAQMTAKLIVE